MPRTGGEATRKRILRTAETLFAKRGFDATSVELIARTAKVNKALVYYYFESKDDLILNLFSYILDELEAFLRREATAPSGPSNLQEEIEAETRFLEARKRILALMLSDALRSGDREDFLFRCASLAMQRGHGDAQAAARGARSREDQRALVHDFFTGFIPLIAFVTLGDKWCRHFHADRSTVREDFVQSFARSHLATHEPSAKPGARSKKT